MLPTPAQQRRVNRAWVKLVKQLDQFETVCAENDSPLMEILFVNRPDAEFSEVYTKYRKQSAVRRDSR